MQISGVNGTESGTGISAGSSAAKDSYSENIQRQIDSIRQQMQELSQNDSMTMEEKMKKRQQMQQQINELNNELRKHQIEQRRQKQEERSSMDRMLPDASGNVEDSGNGNVISASQMKSMISADSSMTVAKAGKRTASELEGKAKVLEGEIRSDVGRGVDVEKKQKQLQDLESRAASATANQIKQLSGAVEDMKQASESSGVTETEDSEKEETEGSTETESQQQPEFLRRVDVLL